MGTALGAADANAPGKQDHLVILDFGDPGAQGGTYGANMDRNKGYISTSDINNAAYQFAISWWIATGANHTAHLTLVIGTNTYQNGVNAAHAAAWAQAVDPLHSNFALDYRGQVMVTAGIDAEIGASPWNPPSVDIAWVDGYIANGTCAPGKAATEAACLYNFGNAQCPETGFGNCDDGWSMDNLWYVSYGARESANTNPFVLPLPEIYNTIGSNARQWQNMSLYSATCANPCQPAATGRSGAMHFVGALTQYMACQQVETQGQSCSGVDNDPTTGYLQLASQLGNDNHTAQSVRWSTDIKYQTFP